jgi:hypothetical protein
MYPILEYSSKNLRDSEEMDTVPWTVSRGFVSSTYQVIFINGEREDYGWTKVQGVGVLKDKVLKLRVKMLRCCRQQTYFF